MKLNIGGAAGPALEGFSVVDKANGDEACPLTLLGMPIEDNSCDEVYASHILEHFPQKEIQSVVDEWARVLKPGGRIRIAVPDISKIAQKIVDKEQGLPISGYIYGAQSDETNYHKAAFNEPTLKLIMERAGLVEVEPWVSEIKDCASLEISLNLQAVKPVLNDFRLTPDEVGIVNAVRLGCPYLPERIEGVHAAIAMPRYGFTHQFFDMYEALVPLGIPIIMKSGIWWGQQLSAILEKLLENKEAKYLLTIDYDSRFGKADVQELHRLMEANPNIDAMAPVQIRRGSKCPLLTIRDPITCKNKAEIPYSVDEGIPPLLKVHTAHFGLTFLRVESMRNFPKPWFHSLPDREAAWDVEKGAIQEDIYFWRKWEDAGKSLFIASDVRIGHQEEIVLYPNDNLSGEMIELSDWETMRRTRARGMA